MMFYILAAPAKAEPPPRVFTIGFGSSSTCAEWLHEGLTQGSNWILGYWSGRNAENGVSHEVGSTIDDDGIIEEMKHVCKAEPSLRVTDAVDKVYERFLKENR